MVKCHSHWPLLFQVMYIGPELATNILRVLKIKTIINMSQNFQLLLRVQLFHLPKYVVVSSLFVDWNIKLRQFTKPEGVSTTDEAPLFELFFSPTKIKTKLISSSFRWRLGRCSPPLYLMNKQSKPQDEQNYELNGQYILNKVHSMCFLAMIHNIVVFFVCLKQAPKLSLTQRNPVAF